MQHWIFDVIVVTEDSYMWSKSAQESGSVDLENFCPAITYLRFYIQVCFLAMIGHSSSC